MIDKEVITTVVFDVDGTLYRKEVEYNTRTGSIQVAHDFFRYSAHQMLKQGIMPEEVSTSLVNEYRQRIQRGTLKERVASIDLRDREEWDRLVKEYGANGKVFDHWHRLEEREIKNFLHKMLSTIDFRATLNRDERLLDTFAYLEDQGYDLGILTSEVYATLEDVAAAMDFDLGRFNIGDDPKHPDLYSISDGQHYPVICRNNSISKPDLDGFRKVMRILGVSDDGGQQLVYVGDDLKKDIVPALRCGWQAVLVTNKDSETGVDAIEVNGNKLSYARISELYGLRGLL